MQKRDSFCKLLVPLHQQRFIYFVILLKEPKLFSNLLY